MSTRESRNIVLNSAIIFYFFSKQDLVPSASRTKPYQLSLGRRRGSSLYVDGRIRWPERYGSPSLAPDMIFILRPLPALPTPLTAIERWRSGCPWPATMDHTHSAADSLASFRGGFHLFCVNRSVIIIS